ncbi:serine/threonine-protein kinase [Nocardiopsis rhodophaea]|uniref:serine/threonine-protein kinase n=1 Tax=Nocardiopsis rhodophaea TaxID=280238 RepID=UPI0031E0B1C5
MPSDGLPKNLEPLAAGDPATIGPYVLAGRLGSGGMGTVYLGRAPEKGAQVAIKVIRPELAFDEATRARFHDEMENARRVASFCTAKILDHGTFENRPYMVTEYIAGTALAEHIAEHGALDSSTLHGFALGVAAALAAIHRAGLVHRDLKPANVLLSLSGPRVIDFGIARAMDTRSNHTQTGIVMGSPGWMAPEQLLEEQVTTSADIFAWGCLVAFAGNGTHPFGNGDAMTLGKRVLFAEPQLGSLDSPLDRLVRQALAKEPERRPKAQDLMLELAGGEDGPGGATDMVSHALHQSWRPNLPPMPPMPPQGHHPGPHPNVTGMRHPGPTPAAPPGQGPPPYPQQHQQAQQVQQAQQAQQAHHAQQGQHPQPAQQAPQAQQAQQAPRPPANQSQQMQRPVAGVAQQPPVHQTGQFPVHQTGQMPAVAPNQTGPIPQVGPQSPPPHDRQRAGQAGPVRPQAQPYVPPVPPPPHRPLQPTKRRMKWVAMTAVIAAALVLVLFTALTMLGFNGLSGLPWFGQGDGSGEQQKTGAQQDTAGGDSDVDDQTQPSRGADADAKMVFKAQEYTCTPDPGERSIPNKGTYCVFTLFVENTSDHALTLNHEWQELKGRDGEVQSAEKPLGSETNAPLWHAVESNDAAEGTLVFFVEDESMLDSAKLVLRSQQQSEPAEIRVNDIPRSA